MELTGIIESEFDKRRERGEERNRWLLDEMKCLYLALLHVSNLFRIQAAH